MSPVVFRPSREPLSTRSTNPWNKMGGRVEPSFISVTQPWDQDRRTKSSSKTSSRDLIDPDLNPSEYLVPVQSLPTPRRPAGPLAESGNTCHDRLQRAQKKDILNICCAKTIKSISHIQLILKKLVKSEAFEVFTFLAISLNCIELIFQTFAEVEVWGEWYFAILDSIFLCIYFMEAVLKILAFGLHYFHSWNNLDFVIVIMALLDFVLKQIYFSSAKRLSQSKTVFRILKIFKSLRSLRAIRVLWKLNSLSSLRKVWHSLARSASSITAILVLMFTCLFFFSVVLRTLFHETDPKRFENLLTTSFTLFTLLTLDDWSMIYLDSLKEGAWYIIPILMVYIIIQYFIFLNLVIAVLVDNFQLSLRESQEKAKEQKEALRHVKLLDESLTILEKEVEEQKSDVILLKTIQKKYGKLAPL
ncbi:cation channel sperm-associated protein 1-like [Gracilinanus agilis]|uniref:cation channel sperm-associated protein 1-like n=1 Tax=Gracilinanus agilis TaxID=191870 RepID=UPI001CFE7729|nr:cation channel sperm-associated protein 1-like [Gracilinanus agilis]